MLYFCHFAKNCGSNVAGENCLQVNLSRAEEVRQLQADNNQLNILLLKLRTINTWRQNFSQANYLKAVSKKTSSLQMFTSRERTVRNINIKNCRLLLTSFHTVIILY